MANDDDQQPVQSDRAAGAEALGDHADTMDVLAKAMRGLGDNLR